MSEKKRKRTHVEEIYGDHALVDDVDRGAGVARIVLPSGEVLTSGNLDGLKEGQGGDPRAAAAAVTMRKQLSAGDDGGAIKLGGPPLTDLVAALRMAGKR